MEFLPTAELSEAFLYDILPIIKKGEDSDYLKIIINLLSLKPINVIIWISDKNQPLVRRLAVFHIYSFLAEKYPKSYQED